MFAVLIMGEFPELVNGKAHSSFLLQENRYTMLPRFTSIPLHRLAGTSHFCWGHPIGQVEGVSIGRSLRIRSEDKDLRAGVIERQRSN